MSKWQEKRTKPVLPFYLAAAVWPVGALLLPIYSLPGLLITAAASAAVYFGTARLCPERVLKYEVPFATGSEDVDTMLQGITEQLNKLHGLNDIIPDAALSDDIARMEQAGRGIVAEVEKTPAKANQIDRFARYYLPESVKIMQAYANMVQGGIKGENAAQILTDVRKNGGTMATAFENQLDSLYASEAMDISTDIEVLDGILKAQNLAK